MARNSARVSYLRRARAEPSPQPIRLCREHVRDLLMVKGFGKGTAAWPNASSSVSSRTARSQGQRRRSTPKGPAIFARKQKPAEGGSVLWARAPLRSISRSTTGRKPSRWRSLSSKMRRAGVGRHARWGMGLAQGELISDRPFVIVRRAQLRRTHRSRDRSGADRSVGRAARRSRIFGGARG